MKKAVVMGSLVLDIVPSLRSGEYREIKDIFVQGKVTELKGVSFYTGGCVGNTGMALHKLGIPVTLACKVGCDFAGNTIELLLSKAGAPYTLLRMENAPTSVSLAITPPGIDKITLFLKGASQEYNSGDGEIVKDCDLFHFGYPVTMKQMYSNNGEELMRLMKTVKARGITTSLDTALPRPDSEHGSVNWRPILERVLPYVDIFVPSIEECLFMLDRDDYAKRFAACGDRDMIQTLDSEEVRGVAEEFLKMGVKIVLLKLGSRGLYLRTAEAAAFASAGAILSEICPEWYERELWIKPNKVEKIVSTTGAGDVAIAGFLSTLLGGGDATKAMRLATTAASLCIQSADTISLLPDQAGLEALARNAERLENEDIPEKEWHYCAEEQLYIGSRDRSYSK